MMESSASTTGSRRVAGPAGGSSPIGSRLVTAPVSRSTLRSAWLPVSATISTSSMRAMPPGSKKRASVPAPSRKPGLLPATVVTLPVSMCTLRRRWLYVSDTTKPCASAAMPVGCCRRASPIEPS